MKIKRCLAGILMLPILAFAQGGAGLAEYREASVKFAALVAGAETAKNQQLLQTQEADLLVATLSDEQRFLKPRRYEVKDMGDLLDLCGMSNKAVSSLTLFDLKAHIDPQGSQQQIVSQTVVLMEQNIGGFENQLRRLQPFLIRCLAKEIAPMTEFALALTPEQLTDVRRKALQGFRAGMVEIFVGILISVGETKYDEGYRLALVRVLAEAAPAFVPTMQVPIRRQVRADADAAAKSPPPNFGPSLDSIRGALDDVKCTGLCSL